MIATLLQLATHAEVNVNPFSAQTGPGAAIAVDPGLDEQRCSQPLPMLRWKRSAATSQSPTAKGSAPMQAAQQAFK